MPSAKYRAIKDCQRIDIRKEISPKSNFLSCFSLKIRYFKPANERIFRFLNPGGQKCKNSKSILASSCAKATQYRARLASLPPRPPFTGTIAATPRINVAMVSGRQKTRTRPAMCCRATSKRNKPKRKRSCAHGTRTTRTQTSKGAGYAQHKNSGVSYDYLFNCNALLRWIVYAVRSPFWANNNDMPMIWHLLYGLLVGWLMWRLAPKRYQGE